MKLQPGNLCIIGFAGPTDVATHLRNAGTRLALEPRFLDMSSAYEGSTVRRKIDWWFRDRRPRRLQEFSSSVKNQCRQNPPSLILTTGFAPVTADTVGALRSLGSTLINYLTDDPWTSPHRSKWFLEALTQYDFVFTPRRSNLDDLNAVGCRNVMYLPFAYAPEIHYPEDLGESQQASTGSADVLFIGGADRDRVPFLAPLAEAGYNVALYGRYWDRFRSTRPLARGMVDEAAARQVVANTKIAPCLVRRSNRDGHSMRTFELSAMKACMAVEDTEEHRSIFGEEGDAVFYFRDPEGLLARVDQLIANDDERKRLADRVHSLITTGSNTYEDRLKTMIGAAGSAEHRS